MTCRACLNDESHNTGKDVDLLAQDALEDPNTVAAILKQFFRDCKLRMSYMFRCSSSLFNSFNSTRAFDTGG